MESLIINRRTDTLFGECCRLSACKTRLKAQARTKKGITILVIRRMAIVKGENVDMKFRRKDGLKLNDGYLCLLSIYMPTCSKKKGFQFRRRLFLSELEA